MSGLKVGELDRRIPYIVDIKRNALDDGPGIRSVVFFKGCPLRCVWCQNPESLDPRPQIQREVASCGSCRACFEVCPHDQARPASEPEEQDTCDHCGACVEVCSFAARRVAGALMEVEALVEALLRDEVFYQHSGGGVTLSGGEPTMFVGYAGRVAAELRRHGVNVLLETCGHFAWQSFAQHLLPNLSAIYFDLKLIDPEEHRVQTGATNERILDNLHRLASSASREDGVELLPRVPLVPGITDGEQNLQGIALHLAQLHSRD